MVEQQTELKIPPMKVWQLTDSEWYMAPTLIDAIGEAMRLTGLDADEVADKGAHECDREDLEFYTFRDDDGTERTYQEEFERRLATNPVTQHFASSDC